MIYFPASIKNIIELYNSFEESDNVKIFDNDDVRENIVKKIDVVVSYNLNNKLYELNMKTLKEEEINVTGRHDPCIVRRANIVIRCVTALVIADLMIERYGKEIFYI